MSNFSKSCKVFRLFVLVMAVHLLSLEASYAQYFDLGTSPHSIRWKQLESNGNKYIFAEDNHTQATRFMNYIDTIKPYINYGFEYGPLTFPILMQPQNFASNGLMMLAPKRMEINIAPNIDSFSEPWLKQLATHEYRHSVQYANMNQHFIKFMSYVVGQQGSLIGAALLPLWFMEGDAVCAETQFSSYGRGMQPSFSMEYRAMIDEVVATKTSQLDRWFCGSYKNFTPDHYQLGYQIVSYANYHYKTNIWDKLADYASRYPFLIFPTHIASRKFYDTSTTELTRATFNRLDQFWKSVGENQNSATLIQTPTRGYTTYTSPMPVNDSTMLSVKSDFKRPSRVVKTNIQTGEEQHLFYTGSLSTQPSQDAMGRLFWTEYRYSTFWDQKINSQLCYYLPSDKRAKPKAIRTERQALFPQGLSSGELAYVEYHYDGHYSINIMDANFKNSRSLIDFPDSISLHGLAYDQQMAKFYTIHLSDDGMSIVSVDEKDAKVEVVKDAAYVTLSNLRAQDGKLYFHSIASGLDEVHTLDLSSGKEYQLTLSRYGSFDPMPAKDNSKVFLTQYSTDGYLLSSQTIDTVLEVRYSQLPVNRVNPEQHKWDVPNIDTIIVSSHTDKEVKPYRKGAHLFNIHSWAPISYNPGAIVDDDRINVDIGATIVSQNILNSAISYFSYAWTDYGSTLRGGLEYKGWAAKFSFDAEYAFKGRLVYDYTGQSTSLPDDKHEGNFNISGTVYLPMTFSSGYYSRLLQPSVSLVHSNALYQNSLTGDYQMKSQKLAVVLQYLEQSRQATQDLQPRWGYHLKLSSVLNPFTDDCGQIFGAYASGYLPGIVVNHGMKLSASYQYQQVGTYNYAQKDLFPRGCDYDFATARYASTSFDYVLPLCYPDGGINSLLYFKRISARLGFDYARYSRISSPDSYSNLYSYGCELLFDINVLRVPSLATTQFGVWIFKPSNSGKVSIGLSVDLPL